MTDNRLIEAFKVSIDRMLKDYGISDFEVSRLSQPTDQFAGASEDSDIKTQIFIHQVAREVIQNCPEEIGGFLRNTRAIMLQFDVLKWNDLENPIDYTANDIAEILSDLIFDRAFIKEIRKYGIRLESRSSIRSQYFINDRERFENVASLDVTASYTNTRIRKPVSVNNVFPAIERI